MNRKIPHASSSPSSETLGPRTRPRDLIVYQRAAQFLVAADAITTQLPRGRAYLVDQLRRAATSIQANIAEGAGEFSRPEKARFYRMARRSAAECAALLDVVEQLRLADEVTSGAARALVEEVEAMLISLVRKMMEE